MNWLYCPGARWARHFTSGEPSPLRPVDRKEMGHGYGSFFRSAMIARRSRPENALHFGV